MTIEFFILLKLYVLKFKVFESLCLKTVKYIDNNSIIDNTWISLCFQSYFACFIPLNSCAECYKSF